jgi:hypothetical protein
LRNRTRRHLRRPKARRKLKTILNFVFDAAGLAVFFMGGLYPGVDGKRIF